LVTVTRTGAGFFGFTDFGFGFGFGAGVAAGLSDVTFDATSGGGIDAGGAAVVGVAGGWAGVVGWAGGVGGGVVEAINGGCFPVAVAGVLDGGVGTERPRHFDGLSAHDST